MPPPPKGYARPLHNVTVKMETPVIYFYANQPFAAHVRVGFNGGSISQWFPAPAAARPAVRPRPNLSGSVAAGTLISQKYQGGIEWNVEAQLLSADDKRGLFSGRAKP